MSLYSVIVSFLTLIRYAENIAVIELCKHDKLYSTLLGQKCHVLEGVKLLANIKKYIFEKAITINLWLKFCYKHYQLNNPAANLHNILSYNV